ncbi:MAG TPA: LON peptidase substrate-binding domain-containing protein [Dehalococcoidia bacterium]|nr:LON peptidase substrate-binding domain-containing protein [Dehalococcoidia bacterium]
MELPLFPLNTVLFPGNTIPLHIFEDRYKLMIGECIAARRPFGVVLIRRGQEAGSPVAEPFEVGTTARVVDAETLDDGKLNITCLGLQRFRVLGIRRREPYLVGDIEMLEGEPLSKEDADREIAELDAQARNLFAEYVRLNLTLTHQWARIIEMPDDSGALADFIGHRLAVDLQAKQRLLEEASPRHRLKTEVSILAESIRLLEPRVRAARSTRWAGLGAMN